MAVPRAHAANLIASLAGKGLDRRAFLEVGAATVGAAALTGWLADTPAAEAAGLGASNGTVPAGLTGTIKDLKHVVILCQENRSFDHYYGMVPGVKGFGDKQALTFPDGRSVFHQPDSMRSDGGYLLPFRIQSGKVNALGMQTLPHGWMPDGLGARNDGAWDGWTRYKGELTMGHFDRDDIPWHWALVDNWTICDDYHCGYIGSTDPNRSMIWAGTVDPTGRWGDTQVVNPVRATNYKTLYNFMQDAGVDWGEFPGKGNGNNGGWYPQWMKSAATSNDPVLREIARRGGSDLAPITLLGDDHDPANIPLMLRDFTAACANNALPEVTFLSSLGGWDEHPASDDRGMAFTYAVIKALASNPDVWNSTALITTYDENDGLFDHVLPPMAEPGTVDEFQPNPPPAGTALPPYGATRPRVVPPAGTPLFPIGPHARVPTMIISPWTRRNGGAVCSEVFDHTSISQFLETWLAEGRGYENPDGTPKLFNPNLTQWRRQVSGNLISAFDFANPDFSVPALPDADLLVAAVVADRKLPLATPPAVGKQTMPVPAAEDPDRRRLRRPVPYEQDAVLTVDHATAVVTVTMTNEGDSGCSMLVFPDAYRPFRATPYTVLEGASRTHVWDASETDGRYQMTVYSADRFIRTYWGTVFADDMSIGGRPSANSELVTGADRLLRLHLGNDGFNDLIFTLSPHDYAGTEQTVVVAGGTSTTFDWPVDMDGYYDVIVTDTSDTGFKFRAAGRINITL
jgi:phospholipase C